MAVQYMERENVLKAVTFRLAFRVHQKKSPVRYELRVGGSCFGTDAILEIGQRGATQTELLAYRPRGATLGLARYFDCMNLIKGTQQCLNKLPSLLNEALGLCTIERHSELYNTDNELSAWFI